MKVITEQWIQALYYGSLFTACGGGEYSEHLPSLVVKQLRRHGSVPLLSLRDLDEGSSYLTVGIMGSMLESSLQTGAESKDVVRRYCDAAGVSCSGVFTIEASSLNVLFPILTAAMLKVPIIDGDCMGRAFPEFQMTTAQAAGRSIVPISIMTPGGEYYHFEDLDNLIFELKAREIVSHTGGIAYFAGFSLRAQEVRSLLIPGTLSFSHDIGACFLDPVSYPSLLWDLQRVTKNSIYGRAVELFIGSIISLKKVNEGGRSWMEFTLQGNGDYQGSRFSLLTQNEALIAFRDDRIAAMVPDIITMIDMHSLKPVSLSAMHKDLRVAVIGVPAPVRLKTEEMLRLLGPDCFGYSSEYIPIEQIYRSCYFN